MDHRSDNFLKFISGFAFSIFSYVVIYFASLLIACFLDTNPLRIGAILSALLLIVFIAAIIIFKPKYKIILYILSLLVCAAPSITLALSFGNRSYENGYLPCHYYSYYDHDDGRCYDCFGKYRQKTITRNGETYHYDFRKKCYFYYHDYYDDYNSRCSEKVYCEEIY